jgi:hypothetical protein
MCWPSAITAAVPVTTLQIAATITAIYYISNATTVKKNILLAATIVKML